MTRTKTFAAALAAAIVASQATAWAQSAPAFEKNNYSYSEWSKSRYSDAVTVSFAGPAKMIFLAGMGAEEENGKSGDIRHKDDFAAQCRYAYDKVKRALEKNGAGFGDVVKVVAYVTDMRYLPDYGQVPSGGFRSGAAAGPHALGYRAAGMARHDGRGRRDGDGAAEITKCRQSRRRMPSRSTDVNGPAAFRPSLRHRDLSLAAIRANKRL
jgi:2-iminobutanoate/2-iminopropanoate deaminase